MHYQYKKDELEVGMEVASERIIAYMWSKHNTKWVVRKIVALSPKKTKVTFDDGSTKEFRKNCGSWYTGLFKPDEEMVRVNKTVAAYLKARRCVDFIRDNAADMEDDAIIRVAKLLEEAVSIAGGENGKVQAGQV